MKKITELREPVFDTSKLCVNAPYLLKKGDTCRICTVVTVSNKSITVSYFNKFNKLCVEMLTPAKDFELSICGDNIINIETEPTDGKENV